MTSLDKGEPVAGAEVHIRDCRGKLHWQGKTDGEGIARISKRLSDKLPYCSSERQEEKDYDGYSDNSQEMLSGLGHGLFVFARKQDDLTFVHSSWDKGIESWRFNLPYARFKEQTIAHTVFDRTLVRAGETVQMKHFMRNHTMQGFDLRKVADLPQVAVVDGRVLVQINEPWNAGSGLSFKPDTVVSYDLAEWKRDPVSPWGKPTKGYKTRHNKRTDRWIVFPWSAEPPGAG